MEQGFDMESLTLSDKKTNNEIKLRYKGLGKTQIRIIVKLNVHPLFFWLFLWYQSFNYIYKKKEEFVRHNPKAHA